MTKFMRAGKEVTIDSELSALNEALAVLREYSGDDADAFEEEILRMLDLLNRALGDCIIVHMFKKSIGSDILPKSEHLKAVTELESTSNTKEE